MPDHDPQTIMFGDLESGKPFRPANGVLRLVKNSPWTAYCPVRGYEFRVESAAPVVPLEDETAEEEGEDNA